MGSQQEYEERWILKELMEQNLLHYTFEANARLGMKTSGSIFVFVYEDQIDVSIPGPYTYFERNHAMWMFSEFVFPVVTTITRINLYRIYDKQLQREINLLIDYDDIINRYLENKRKLNGITDHEPS